MARACWYCAGDPPDEHPPCEACDERERLLRRFEAAIKLVYPDEMTPMAKRVLEQIIEDEGASMIDGYERPGHMTTELSLEVTRALIAHPNERFGQMLVNVMRDAYPHDDRVMWDITDEEWASLLRAYARR